MARRKIKNATDQRKFIMVYHDFLESNLLTVDEKMIFIILKKFADSNNQCFPSLKKLADITGVSKRKIQDVIKSLEKKHVLSIESRIKSDGGRSSNLYTLYDIKEIWNNGNNEVSTLSADEIEERHMIEKLTAKGYHVTKEKELVSAEPTKVTAETSTIKLKQSNINDDTTNTIESQGMERYTLEQIKQLFSYETMLYDNPYQKDEIDSVMSILHTTMNTTRESIRIAGEDKPTMAVIGKLMKLHKESILYSIEKFKEQTERIKNPTAYMLTILYNAPEQYQLDIENMVSHDMANCSTDGKE